MMELFLKIVKDLFNFYTPLKTSEYRRISDVFMEEGLEIE